MNKVRVISSEKDGSDLRRNKAKDRYYVVCDGTTDNEEIDTAISSLGNKHIFSYSSETWERIFGIRKRK